MDRNRIEGRLKQFKETLGKVLEKTREAADAARDDQYSRSSSSGKSSKKVAPASGKL